MSYTITYNKLNKIVELRFQDFSKIEAHFKSRQEVVALCQEKKVKRILVHLGDVVPEETLTTEEKLKFAKSWSSDIPSQIHFGIVMPQDIDSQNEFYGIIHLAKISGIMMKPFYTEKLAIEWLSSIT